MKTNFFATLLISMLACNLYAAQSEKVVKIKTNKGVLEGTLIVPEAKTPIPVALLIAGSGPTDRDGNNPFMRNNSLKMLATGLAKNGIASLRYDKRGIGNSKKAMGKEADLRFEHYISDANDCIAMLKKNRSFSEIVVIGHSEGSLIGMVASQNRAVSKFISIAGPGASADKTLKEQLKSQPPQVLQIVTPIIDKLVQGQTVNNVPPMLNSLFRPSVQPYLISWFRYDPAKKIAKLDIPVLIIQGSTDIQVSVKDATILAKANPKAQKRIIAGMNHVFKKSELNRTNNLKTYNEPDTPIVPQLVESIAGFINKPSHTNK